MITQQQNLAEPAVVQEQHDRFQGVTYQHGKWLARIEKDGRSFNSASHTHLKTAALVYDCAAVTLFGAAYVWRNLPDQPFSPELQALVRGYLERAG
ncbi:MAG: hypothetical protein IPK17_22480 [Chloroflexi bacterium]|uniref:hypothetical protein n=1 Tax=Candidatus Flexifilum breve TaxID=3140694 RepID=UPI00313731C8|nr:hypothetical protein [Chloroflexota bacterium]